VSPPPVPQAVPRRWPRALVLSAGVRFGMIYAGVFALSTLALAVFLWWSTAGLLDRQTEAAINADTQGLRERYADGGLLSLEDTIEQRLIGNVDDDALDENPNCGNNRWFGDSFTTVSPAKNTTFTCLN